MSDKPWKPAGIGGGFAEPGQRAQTVVIGMSFRHEGNAERYMDVKVGEQVDFLRDDAHLKEIEKRLLNILHHVINYFYPQCDVSSFSDYVKPNPDGSWERFWAGERTCQGCNGNLPLDVNGDVGQCPNPRCRSRLPDDDYCAGLREIVGDAFSGVDPDHYVREIRGDEEDAT